MRVLAAFPLALLSAAASAGSPPAHRPAASVPTNGEIRVAPGEGSDRMNLFRQGRGCKSILRQVAGANRRQRGRRLDQEPPARAILAVDRQVNGCHEVAFLRAEPRR